MPFIRYSRDKRGYENTYVMHAYHGGHGAAGTRVLYFFHSPSHVKVGRRALDAEVLEALEHTHPDLPFDWPSLLRQPAPPPAPVVDWRERRGAGRTRARGQARTSSAPPARPTVEVEDETVLGRTLGVAEAARLRGRYRRVARADHAPGADARRSGPTDRARGASQP